MMEPRVLVAYATRSGTTAELASTMAEVLREHGVRPDVYSAQELAGLEPYDAVVLVAPLYIGRLHRDARRFLKRHRRRLETLPVALLAPGPVDNKETSLRAANWRRSWRAGHGFLQWRRRLSAECSTRTGSDFLTR